MKLKLVKLVKQSDAAWRRLTYAFPDLDPFAGAREFLAQQRKVIKQLVEIRDECDRLLKELK